MHAVNNPSAVLAPHSTQSASTAAGSPIQSRPSSTVPAPTVISAIAGAPQKCDITRSAAWARARSRCLIQCTAQVAVSAIKSKAASVHTARAAA
jgi:hypothetical protein